MRQVSGSKHVVNLAVKLVFFTIVLSLLLPAGAAGDRYTFGGVLWLSVALTLLAYVVGDLWVLPTYGNWTAVAADAGIAVLGLWALPPILGTPDIGFGTIILAALILAVGEYYFHRYLRGQLGLAAGAGQGGARGTGGDDDQGNG